MLQSPAVPQPRLRHRPLVGTPTWLVLGVVGWAGVVYLGVKLFALVPPQAGFDLELLLRAGRRVAEGGSPYDAAMLAGQVPTATDLFYSYPPPVAQYLSLFAAVPSSVMLAFWGIVAAIGVLLIAMALGRLDARARGQPLGQTLRAVGLPALAVAPFVFPFAIATLFGNLDALFPLLYGLMLVGALGPRLGAQFGGGAGLAIGAIAKLHPASMGLWFLVRGLRDRRRPRAASGTDRRWPGSWVVLAAAVAVGLVIVVFSLVAGGLTPWADYVTVLRASAAADVVDLRNIGPASQVARLTGGGEGLARGLQIVVTIAALIGTAAAAWYRDDPIESFAWATVASLVILPVTWFHYPVALIPTGVVAALRAGGTDRRLVGTLLTGALVIAVLAVAAPVLVWVSVGLVLVAVRRSLPAGGSPSVRDPRELPDPVPVRALA